MTIEEYDRKKPIRKTIQEIDDCLDAFAEEELAEKTSYAVIPRRQVLGVGVEISGAVGSYFVRSRVLIEQFKRLLLEEKQRLLDEFSNDK